jgi:hypothetical protein
LPSILAVGSAYDSHKFFNLAALLRFGSCGYCVFNAMPHMISKDFFLQSSQRRSHGRYLRNDIDAVPVLFHHAGKPADLTLNPSEAFPA